MIASPFFPTYSRAEYPFITRNGYKLSWDKDFSKITANITVNAVWTVIKPEKVTSLTAESGKKSIALSWDETEYAGYYLVYRKADSEKEYTQVAKTTKILWTDSKAVPGTQYSYKVVAVRSLSGKKYQGAESDVVTSKIGTPQIVARGLIAAQKIIEERLDHSTQPLFILTYSH